MGGMVAQIMALKEPTMVASLVLANSCCTFPEEMRSAVAERGRLAQQGGMAAIVEQTLSRWFTSAFLNSPVADGVRQRLLGDDPVVWSRTWQAIARVNVRERLTEIACPCS
jgi:pimeloyl-ACP methyl ester carboxylesterase